MSAVWRYLKVDDGDKSKLYKVVERRDESEYFQHKQSDT